MPQVAAERFAERLAAGLPGRLYFFHGEEPLQVAECSDALRAALGRDGIAERVVFDGDTGIDWAALAAEASALSLFASTRLIEVRLGARKPDKTGGEVLERFAAEGAGDDVLLVTAGKLDASARKQRWFKALEQAALTVATRELRLDALPAWLTRRAARRDKRLAPAAARLVAERVEGNMLAAAQEVEKLCLLVDGDTIGEDEVVRAVQDSTRYDVFQLADAVLAGEVERAVRILRGLREEGTEALLANWAIGRELRQLTEMALAIGAGARPEQAMERARVWDSRRALVRRALDRLPAATLCRLLAYANVIDTIVKGARPGDPWDELEILVLNLGGRRGFGRLMERLS